jgi:hypothetical protein
MAVVKAVNVVLRLLQGEENKARGLRALELPSG